MRAGGARAGAGERPGLVDSPRRRPKQALAALQGAPGLGAENELVGVHGPPTAPGTTAPVGPAPPSAVRAPRSCL